MYVRRLLRVYLCLQAVILLLTLAALGVDIAASRTRFIAEGASVSAQRESPLSAAETAVGRLPIRQTLSSLSGYAGALPAPLGCFVDMVLAFRTLYRELAAKEFVNMHKFESAFLLK